VHLFYGKGYNNFAIVSVVHYSSLFSVFFVDLLSSLLYLKIYLLNFLIYQHTYVTQSDKKGLQPVKFWSQFLRLKLYNFFCGYSVTYAKMYGDFTEAYRIVKAYWEMEIDIIKPKHMYFPALSPFCQTGSHNYMKRSIQHQFHQNFCEISHISGNRFSGCGPDDSHLKCLRWIYSNVVMSFTNWDLNKM